MLPSSPVDYTITFNVAEDIEVRSTNMTGLNFNVDTVTDGKAGHTTLEVDTFKFTNVDANTTILGGRGTNTFAITGDTAFPGTVLGYGGLRPLASYLSVDVAKGVLDGNPPNPFATNRVDFSASKFLQPSYVNLRTTARTSVSVETVTDGQNAKEVQRLAIPNANKGSFTLSLGATPTAPIQFGTDTFKTAKNIENALNTLLGAGKVVVTTAGPSGLWDITFQDIGNQSELKFAESETLRSEIAASEVSLTPSGSTVKTVHELTVPNDPGAFTLTLNGKKTPPINALVDGSNRHQEGAAEADRRKHAAVRRREGRSQNWLA